MSDKQDCCGMEGEAQCVETEEITIFPGVVLRTDTIPCHYEDDQLYTSPYCSTD